MNKTQVIEKLHALANPDKVKFKEEKFAVKAHNSLGIYHADLKILAKEIGWNSQLGTELFNSEIYEAQLLCSKIFKPTDLTIELAERWVITFKNWEICDSFSMAVFAKSQYALELIKTWANREAEFEKRAAFATMAGYGLADKIAGNEVFEALLPLIVNASTDERNFVKKSVNWALRTIGKRNNDLKQSVIQVCNQLLNTDYKSARWIAKDALRELEKPNVKMQDHPRKIYRPK